jgi:hypothetical protein
MSESREKLFFHWSESSQRFDYYVTGLVAAAVVYLIKEYHPAPIGLNPPTIELVAIVLLAVSLFAGLTQLESKVTILRVTHDLSPKEEFLKKLRTRRPGQKIASEKTPSVDLSEAEITAMESNLGTVVEKAKKSRDRHRTICKYCYTVRNVGLLAGILLLLLAKVETPYLGSPNQSVQSTPTTDEQVAPVVK